MHGVTANPQSAHNPPRKLLLVSYWYPPAVGAAAERIYSFAKSLPDHGWHTHVLTAEPAGACSETRGVTVHQVPDRFAVKGRIFPDYDPTHKPSRLRAYLREFVFPDRFVTWQRAAFKLGRDYLRREPCHLILASFPPASAVLLALNLHRESGVRLVLDFRDRWIGPGGYGPRRAGARRAHAQLERTAIAAASAIVTVSDAMADAIAHEQAYDRQRIFVIPNGYEPTNPAPTSTDTQSAMVLTFAHVGTVIPRNRPDLFFESIAALKGHECLRDINFNFVGNLSQAYLDATALSSIIKTTGLLPHNQARREMQNAHVLLLLTGRYVGQWGYNAKVFEYIQTGRPILCLEEEPGSNDRKLLEAFAPDRAFFAPVGRPEAIADEIIKLKQYIDQHPIAAHELDDAFRAYSRPAVCAQLAEHLNAILTPGRD